MTTLSAPPDGSATPAVHPAALLRKALEDVDDPVAALADAGLDRQRARRLLDGIVDTWTDADLDAIATATGPPRHLWKRMASVYADARAAGRPVVDRYRDGVVVDPGDLPPTQYLVLEVLAARARTGEPAWTFPTSIRPALDELARRGLVGYKPSPAPDACLVWLTDHGALAAFDAGYTPPD